MERIVNFLIQLRATLQKSEGIVVDIVSMLITWLTPLPVAYLTYSSMISELSFPTTIALASSLVVETLGIVSVNSLLTFMDFNRQGKGRHAPTYLAVISTIGYLIVIFMLAVGLHQGDALHKLGRGLLASLTAIGAIIIGARASYSRQVAQLEQDKLERKMARLEKQNSENKKQVAELNQQVAQNPLPQRVKLDWRNLPLDERIKISKMSTFDIVSTYKIPHRTATEWRNRARQYAEQGEQVVDARHNNNGHKPQVAWIGDEFGF